MIVGPECLPLGLDTGKVVFLGRISHFEKTADLEACLGARQCRKVDLPESASFLIYTSGQIIVIIYSNESPVSFTSLVFVRPIDDDFITGSQSTYGRFFG